MRDAGPVQGGARDRARPRARTSRVRDGGEVLNLCANNYLGLADHPAVLAAAREALDRWGYGLASVRFICGTQEIHKQLEERLSAFLGTEDTILYGSCFDANGGLFETLLAEQDASSPTRSTTPRSSTASGCARRGDCATRTTTWTSSSSGCARRPGARRILIATDGVFSMDGYLARLDTICDLADRYGALVMVDDSHAVGFIGPTGRGTPELHGVARPRRHRHRDARQGARRRERRLHQRPAGDRRSCCASARAPTCSPTPSPRRSSRRRSRCSSCSKPATSCARPAAREHAAVSARA